MIPTLDPTLAFISMPGGWEWGAILIIGVLLFGRRLPEIGHSIGKSIVEFKRGVRGVKDEIDNEVAKDRAEQEKAQFDKKYSTQNLPEGETSRTVARGDAVEEQPPGNAGNPGSNPNPAV
ncbi:MAG: hypothetical protein Tsb0013_20870 [Phycisphaerales bacterium]